MLLGKLQGLRGIRNEYWENLGSNKKPLEISNTFYETTPRHHKK